MRSVTRFDYTGLSKGTRQKYVTCLRLLPRGTFIGGI